MLCLLRGETHAAQLGGGACREEPHQAWPSHSQPQHHHDHQPSKICTKLRQNLVFTNSGNS